MSPDDDDWSLDSLSTSERVLLRPGGDRIFRSLRHRHRRLILLGVREGLIESPSDIILRGNGDAEAAELELLHDHLPKLDDAGYIDWDPESGTISRGPNFEEIEPLLELIENHADELPPDWP